MPFIRKRDATRFVATPGTISRDELSCTVGNKRDRIESVDSRSRKKNMVERKMREELTRFRGKWIIEPFNDGDRTMEIINGV